MQPVFISIGGFQIHYYGLMYAIAFIVGIQLAKKMAKERGFDPNEIENYAFIAIISGLLGGRLYYVLFQWDYYLANPREILAVWNGGMAIHGGIIGGIIGTVLYGKFKKINPLTLGDYAAAPFLLGQAIGRIGNLMNGEVHGVPTFTPWNVIFQWQPKFQEWYSQYLQLSLEEQSTFTDKVPWGLSFPLDSPAGFEFPNLALHPAMLYEALLNIIGFFILWFVLRKKEKKAPGFLWWNYMIFYSINRILVSFFRAEDLMFFGLRAPHVISILLMFVAGVGLYIGKRQEQN